MNLPDMLGWIWWLTGAAACAGIVIVFLVRLVRREDERAQREGDQWALAQLALILARRTGATTDVLCKALCDGDAAALPAEYERADLRYEREPGSKGRIRKTLVASFQGQQPQRVMVEVGTGWADLPGDVRAEMIRTGGTVTRQVLLPSGHALRRQGVPHVD